MIKVNTYVRAPWPNEGEATVEVEVHGGDYEGAEKALDAAYVQARARIRAGSS